MTSPMKTQLQETKQRYQRSMRKKQIEQKFESIRSKVLDVPKINKEELEKLKESETDKLDLIFKDLHSHPQKSNQIIQALWNDYISYKFNYFNEDHLNRMIQEFIKLKLMLKEERHNEEIVKMISILVWLISNRFSRAQRINPVRIDLSVLIEAQMQLLEANVSIKLNHLILMNFTNLSKYLHIQYSLIKNNVIKKVMRCHLFPGKEEDISIFLSNLIYNLPFKFKLKRNDIQELINFIWQKQTIIKKERFFFQDCLLIINKLLIVNDGAFHREIIDRLDSVIWFYIENLSQHINSKLEDIFQLMTYVYAKNYDNLRLNNEDIYAFIWRNAEVILEGQNLKYLEEDRPLNRIIWKFLQVFARIKHSKAINKLLQDIYARFSGQNHKKIQDFQEIALQILAENYHREDDEELLPFWSEKLVQFYNVQKLYPLLLKRIYEIAIKKGRSIFMNEQDSTLRELIGKLQFQENEEMQLDEKEEIKKMATKIVQLQKQQQANSK